ncbi:PREDICTED: uncharacterized protein LOC108353959 [Rhagoletis zephyria]|uniref:uncharacterized protein LOC108353959 n=1 Tax=Rhagoletis zephyria TaxID=28612 RepID=UPI0008115788|nr:PREDICTED: uncharacterized protein LOC108353959 [Rhagoletis zephyria]
MALYQSFSNNLIQALKSTILTHSLARTFTSQSKRPSYRSHCDSNVPKCSEKSLKEKEDKGECKKDKRQSMWLNPECCLDICKNVLPRFDDLYYKPSDKAKRNYTQTWNECPDIRTAPRKICCFEKVKLPPLERRKKSAHPKTACPHLSKEEKRSCSVAGNKRCLKIRLPGCGVARDPPRCFFIKPAAKCRKICTPYPAFSECKQLKAKPRRPVECNCLFVGPLCGMH